MKLTHDRNRLRRITDAKEFGKVAVLYGGVSTEREVSLVSGAAVLAGLNRRGIDAHGVDPRDVPLASLAGEGFDRVWIALHGPGGEDGTVQGALEVLGLPYTGSGVLGSALGMDKLRTKRLAAAMGVMTADSFVLRNVGDCPLALERLGLPLIVKPATQGSSVGMTKVTRQQDMVAAYRAAAAVDDVVFAEKWITGAEYTVAVLHRR
ncbi:MAG TPA: D-alanine--D-alanine ligase, partial [Steroidobacteraceae bacterium]|nr:D-alanine--D-alanine ligase [Steroidobacteraceae bacterium]